MFIYDKCDKGKKVDNDNGENFSVLSEDTTQTQSFESLATSFHHYFTKQDHFKVGSSIVRNKYRICMSQLVMHVYVDVYCLVRVRVHLTPGKLGNWKQVNSAINHCQKPTVLP